MGQLYSLRKLWNYSIVIYCSNYIRPKREFKLPIPDLSRYSNHVSTKPYTTPWAGSFQLVHLCIKS